MCGRHNLVAHSKYTSNSLPFPIISTGGTEKTKHILCIPEFLIARSSNVTQTCPVRHKQKSALGFWESSCFKKKKKIQIWVMTPFFSPFPDLLS